MAPYGEFTVKCSLGKVEMKALNRSNWPQSANTHNIIKQPQNDWNEVKWGEKRADFEREEKMHRGAWCSYKINGEMIFEQ